MSLSEEKAEKLAILVNRMRGLFNTIGKSTLDGIGSLNLQKALE